MRPGLFWKHKLPDEWGMGLCNRRMYVNVCVSVSVCD